MLEYNQQRYIKFDDSIGRYNYQSGAETPFIRTIYIENPSIDEIKVNSIVSWTDAEEFNLILIWKIIFQLEIK